MLIVEWVSAVAPVAASRLLMTATLVSLLYCSTSTLFQSPAAGAGGAFTLAVFAVSSCGVPLRLNPAPIVLSFNEVRTTGKPGWPMSCTSPPMRSVSSSGTPAAVKPAVAPRSFTTRLASVLLCRRTPP